MDLDSLKAWRGKGRVRYDARDVRLYALGLGIGFDPLDEAQLAHVAGIAGTAVRPLPTMACALGFLDGWVEAGRLDGGRMLHAEQRLTLAAPLPPSGTLDVRARIDRVYDKGAGAGAVVVQTTDIRHADGRELLARLEARVFCRGDGGQGGDPGRPDRLADPPGTPPDATFEQPTVEQQALLYCLSGDDNPMHREPRVAAAAGFPRPILHGLATFGIAGHAVVRLAAGNDPARIASIAAAFVAPVFPGERLATDLWLSGDAVRFRTRSVARGTVVLSGGHATLRPH